MSRNRKAHARARRSAAARKSPPIKGGARSHACQSLARRLHCERLEDRRLLAVVTVDTIDDVVDLDDGQTSLREAIFATNVVPGADEIRFDPALFAAGPRTILLTHGELRKERGISQAELAEILNKQQGEISKIERRKDVKLSTVRDYVQSIDGTLLIVVRMPGGVERAIEIEEEQREASRKKTSAAGR